MTWGRPWGEENDRITGGQTAYGGMQLDARAGMNQLQTIGLQNAFDLAAGVD